MTITPQHVLDELRTMVTQWQGQSLTLARFWAADAEMPQPADFTGTIRTVTAAGFLLVRTVDASEDGQPPATVRVFVQWADLWGPDAVQLMGRIRYRTPDGRWRTESAADAVARWHRRYQAAVMAVGQEVAEHGLESGPATGGSRGARATARAAHPTGDALDRAVPLS